MTSRPVRSRFGLGVLMLLGFNATAFADIIGVGTRSASIFFAAPGAAPVNVGPFDVPLGDVDCVATGACSGPLQLPLTVVNSFSGLVSSDAEAGLIAGFGGDSWGFLPTIGTGVGQSDPFNLTAGVTSLFIFYSIEFFLDAGGLSSTSVQEFLHLSGTVGDGGHVRVQSQFGLVSEALGQVAQLEVEFFRDTPGAFQSTLFGVNPGSGALPAFDTFIVSGSYLFQASNANGPSSVQTTLDPSVAPEPTIVSLMCMTFGGLLVRAEYRRRTRQGRSAN